MIVHAIKCPKIFLQMKGREEVEAKLLPYELKHKHRTNAH